MDANNIVSLIAQIGFPAVVAWYCLNTLNKTMAENTETLSKIRETLAKLCEQHNEIN